MKRREIAAAIWVILVAMFAAATLLRGQEIQQIKPLLSYQFSRDFVSGASNQVAAQNLLGIAGISSSVEVGTYVELKNVNPNALAHPTVYVNGTEISGNFTWVAASTATTNLGTVFKGSTNSMTSELATGRWIRAAAAYGIIYSGWFGMAKDGATDDQAKLSNWIDSIPTDSLGVLEPGTYASASALTKSKSKFAINGYGATIKATGTNTWMLLNAGSDVTLRGLTFDANFKARDCVYSDNFSKRWKMEGVSYLNNYVDNVLDPGGTTTTAMHRMTKGCQDFTWTDCVLSNATFATAAGRVAHGIYATGFGGSTSTDYVKTIKIQRCKFYEMNGNSAGQQDAITIGDQYDQEPMDAEVDDCTFVNWTHRCVKMLGNGIRTHHCFFDNRAGYVGTLSAISIMGSSQADHNYMVGRFFVGIEIDTNVQANNVGASADHNRIDLTLDPSVNATTGIGTTLGTTNVIIDHNTIMNPQWGIVLKATTLRPSVTFNVISNAYQYGIMATDDPANSLASVFPDGAYLEGNQILGSFGAAPSAAIRAFGGTNFNVINNRGNSGTLGYLSLASEAVGRHWGNTGDGHMAAQLRGATVNKSANYAIDTNDFGIFVTANSTMTLPAAAGVPAGQGFQIKAASGVTATVARTGSDTIDQAGSSDTILSLQAAIYLSDGVSNWRKFAFGAGAGGGGASTVTVNGGSSMAAADFNGNQFSQNGAVVSLKFGVIETNGVSKGISARQSVTDFGAATALTVSGGNLTVSMTNAPIYTNTMSGDFTLVLADTGSVTETTVELDLTVNGVNSITWPTAVLPAATNQPFAAGPMEIYIRRRNGQTLIWWTPALIGTADIQNSAVNSAKIQDGTIVDADISSGAAIALTKIAPIANGAVLANSSGSTAPAAAVTTLPSGLTIPSPTISSPTVTGGTLGSPTLNNPTTVAPVITFPVINYGYLGTNNTSFGLKFAGMTNSGGVTQWDVCYINSSGQVVKAAANAAGSGNAIVMAESTQSTGVTLTVLLQGIVRFDTWTWTAGSPLYLSGTAGTLTQTAPTTSTNVVRPVGQALTATQIRFFPGNEYGTVQ